MKQILLVITCLALFSLVACDAGLFDSNRPGALTSGSILQTEASPQGAPASPGVPPAAATQLAPQEPAETKAAAPTAIATAVPQATETTGATEAVQSKAGPSPQPSTATPSEVPPTAPTLAERTIPALDPLLAALAASLKLQPSQLKITELEPVIWPNLCFDFIRSNAAACPGAPVPGYQGLAVTSQALFGGPPLYAFRSSQDAQLVFSLPAAALAARQDLASQLNLVPEAIEIEAVKAVTWSDTCALLPTPRPKNAICLSVAMPGWQIELRVRSSIYKYATDLNGLELLRASGP